jgi:hypothetical protein
MVFADFFRHVAFAGPTRMAVAGISRPDET